MKTLPLRIEDKEWLEKTHEKHHKDQFPFPDFTRNFAVSFKILDEKSEIITAGGVRLFPEMVLITDVEKEQRQRYNALFTALQISQLICKSHFHNELFASAPEMSEWEQILRKIGFTPSKDHNLVIG